MADQADINEFRIKFPEFNAVDDPYVGAALDLADAFLDPSPWAPGNDFALARVFWAAHMLTLQQQNAANATLDGTGMSDLFVRTIRFGERTVGFAQRRNYGLSANSVGPGEEMLALTIYGQMYLQLRSRNIMPIATV